MYLVIRDQKKQLHKIPEVQDSSRSRNTHLPMANNFQRCGVVNDFSLKILKGLLAMKWPSTEPKFIFLLNPCSLCSISWGLRKHAKALLFFGSKISVFFCEGKIHCEIRISQAKCSNQRSLQVCHDATRLHRLHLGSVQRQGGSLEDDYWRIH